MNRVEATQPAVSRADIIGGAAAVTDSAGGELWTFHRFRDADEIGELIPETQSRFTQISAGEFSGQLKRVRLGDLAMHHIYSSAEALNVSFTEAEGAYFLMPFRWSGDLLWDRQPIDRPSILYYPAGVEHVRRGRALEGVALAVRGGWFESTIAALAGIEAPEVRLRRGPIAASPGAAESLRRVVLQTIESVASTPARFRDHRIQESAVERIKSELLSIVMGGSPIDGEERFPKDATRIVRLATDCFEEARDHAVSLADLCRAAGVSARTLHYAFECVCGMSPIQYFKRRRLTIARRALRTSEPGCGAVKVAALNAGFRHLGRFSAEYHALFGENPSETLTSG